MPGLLTESYFGFQVLEKWNLRATTGTKPALCVSTADSR